MDYNELIAQVRQLIEQSGHRRIDTIEPHRVAVELAGMGLLIVAPAVGYAWTLDVNSHAFRHALKEVLGS